MHQVQMGAMPMHLFQLLTQHEWNTGRHEKNNWIIRLCHVSVMVMLCYVIIIS